MMNFWAGENVSMIFELVECLELTQFFFKVLLLNQALSVGQSLQFIPLILKMRQSWKI